ncbi:hypothetical protein LTR37_013362 [Vermiconidia calcicola]|uniref:Uncharacterized protein n=1 Tax=Vermiconidia calcicola TaxID=1690605 RepID=A0ACC3MZL8_9PEZI|nr:hypothetical protein LTR37_013362 [Vermiconidia calcicola]
MRATTGLIVAALASLAIAKESGSKHGWDYAHDLDTENEGHKAHGGRKHGALPDSAVRQYGAQATDENAYFRSHEGYHAGRGQKWSRDVEYDTEEDVVDPANEFFEAENDDDIVASDELYSRDASKPPVKVQPQQAGQEDEDEDEDDEEDDEEEDEDPTDFPDSEYYDDFGNLMYDKLNDPNNHMLFPDVEDYDDFGRLIKKDAKKLDARSDNVEDVEHLVGDGDEDEEDNSPDDGLEDDEDDDDIDDDDDIEESAVEADDLNAQNLDEYWYQSGDEGDEDIMGTYDESADDSVEDVVKRSMPSKLREWAGVSEKIGTKYHKASDAPAAHPSHKHSAHPAQGGHNAHKTPEPTKAGWGWFPW